MNEHWSEIEEVGGSTWHFRFMLWVVCHLPLFLVEFCTAVVCFFFWLGAAPVRARSKIYLKHLRNAGVRVGVFGTYKHILSFALSMMEKLLGWKGAIKLNRIESLFEFFVAVHFAVAVGDAGEVERCRLERVGCGFETLLVPKRFEYIDVCFWSRGLVNLCQDFSDLLERKTVQELAHPDGVCSLWEFCRIVQNVG